jgi:alkylation response protein AidB-like acyl-CoA dehydrogenase
MDSVEVGVEAMDDVSMIREAARDFAESEIRPLVMYYDESQQFPSEVISKLCALGFLGAMVPEKYGGAGLSILAFTAIIEELSRVDPSIGLIVAAHNGLSVGHIALFGSEAQKLKYLPDLCSGEKLGGWGLTEPGSGSDAAGMKTTAVKDGDSYVLNGTKMFITNGSVGSTFVIMAVTGHGEEKKSISAFICEKGMKGFSTGKKENKLGMRSSDTASLIFEDVRVPAVNRIGGEGEGFRQAMTMLDGGRIGIAALSCGLAQGAFDASLKYVKQRRQFGKKLSEFQAIQWKLAEMATDIEAARLLIHKAALLKMQGKNYTLAASQAKLFASEMATHIANEAVQIHGGYGFIKEFPVEKFYRDVKLLTIGEGTSEVQKMIIAKNILR